MQRLLLFCGTEDSTKASGGVDAGEETPKTATQLRRTICPICDKLGDTLAWMKGLLHDSLRYTRPEAESAEIEARHRELTMRKDLLVIHLGTG